MMLLLSGYCCVEIGNFVRYKYILSTTRSVQLEKSLFFTFVGKVWFIRLKFVTSLKMFMMVGEEGEVTLIWIRLNIRLKPNITIQTLD